jgi:dTDP-glucose pyrophosphorylase
VAVRAGSKRAGRGPALIIMAAGVGRRYGGLKQVEPVGPSGETILDYSVFDALASGFETMVFVVSPETELPLRSRMEATIGLDCRVEYVVQELGNPPLNMPVPPGRRKPWGTAHAVLSCRDHVHLPFAVVNADDFYGRDSFAALAAHLKGAEHPQGMLDFCMVGFPLEQTLTEHGQVARGVCVVDRDGNLVGVHERTKIERRDDRAGYLDENEQWVPIPPGSLASMNMWGFTPEFFPELDEGFREFLREAPGKLTEREYFLPDVVNQLLVRRKAKVKVLTSGEQWLGVTYRADMIRARERIRTLIDKGVYPSRLWG